METMAIGTSSTHNRIKTAENIFLHTSTKISENFNIKYLQWTKTYSSKETKQDILRRDTLRISVATIWRFTTKNVSLKILPPVYLHVIKRDTK